ncbi:MAG: hypothetical protein MHMPM18_001343 [Marteilia pararefringens]
MPLYARCTPFDFQQYFDTSLVDSTGVRPERDIDRLWSLFDRAVDLQLFADRNRSPERGMRSIGNNFNRCNQCRAI